MPRRFIYDRMTGEEFREHLEGTGIGPYQFARFTGADIKRAKAWAGGEEDVPHWAALVISLLRQHPANLAAARRLAAVSIQIDNKRPHLGEYPYLQGHDDEQA
ncbi:hypothetical protein [Oceaniradius stylonematis]|uniref:hypothetical protein n=1 Tax=Oceaniradius stylonematis TaxID=2184161 RepID=UPI00273F4363|nr:hypothetical protein [Oceaniradius stylonematis]